MSNEKNSGSAGITFYDILTVAFIALKLTGDISWSWLWVLSPMWISIALKIIAELADSLGKS